MVVSQNPKRRGGFSNLWAVREVDNLFGQIGRYTRFVFYGKRALAAISGLLILTLIAYPLFTGDRSGMRISFVDNKTAKGRASLPVMSNPEYRGLNEKGDQFKVNGKSATQQTENLVRIEAVEGQLIKPDGGWYALSADYADYQQDKKVIDLMGDVTLVDGNGTIFNTEHATIETQTSHIFGTKPITGSGNLGNIVASGFEIKDNGAHIIFTRGDDPVRVQLERAEKKK